jgi:two-component system, chemotaxis family, protein-glutamate methylesterase/glutaminase
VVWGMPGAIAQAGLCHAVLPLTKIAPKLLEMLRGPAR